MSISAGGLSYRTSDTNKPEARVVQQFHTNADTDGSTKALHHTLGPGPNQAAAGNHSHDAGGSSALAGYATIAHTHDLAYWKANVPWVVIPYTGGWGDYTTGGYAGGRYRLVADEVQYRGMIKHATVTTVGAIMTAPPAGWLPTAGTHQFTALGSGGGVVDIRIPSTGILNVNAYGANATGASISLSQIRYSVI